MLSLGDFLSPCGQGWSHPTPMLTPAARPRPWAASPLTRATGWGEEVPEPEPSLPQGRADHLPLPLPQSPISTFPLFLRVPLFRSHPQLRAPFVSCVYLISLSIKPVRLGCIVAGVHFIRVHTRFSKAFSLLGQARRGGTWHMAASRLQP